ncbi:MAG: hypothetical protein ACO3ON_10235 [Ilumatobacteraceae bacterium]
MYLRLFFVDNKNNKSSQSVGALNQGLLLPSLEDLASLLFCVGEECDESVESVIFDFANFDDPAIANREFFYEATNLGILIKKKIDI